MAKLTKNQAYYYTYSYGNETMEGSFVAENADKARAYLMRHYIKGVIKVSKINVGTGSRTYLGMLTLNAVPGIRWAEWETKNSASQVDIKSGKLRGY